MKKKVWTNKKYPKATFTGIYRKYYGDRELVLKRNGGTREISFESHQAAKKAGWICK